MKLAALVSKLDGTIHVAASDSRWTRAALPELRFTAPPSPPGQADVPAVVTYEPTPNVCTVSHPSGPTHRSYMAAVAHMRAAGFTVTNAEPQP